MKTPLLHLALFASCVAVNAAAAQQAVTTLEGSNVKWQIDPKSGKIDTHLGRQSLYMRANSPPALAADVELTDGTIEFDLAPLPNGNFLGLVFRYANPTEHENIYLRLHRSGSFEAVQYAPRLFTTAGIWQLLPEYMASAVFTQDSWLHVRVEIRGSRMEFFAGDSSKPLLTVERMRGATTTGRVGFWARVNERPDQWAVALSNIRITARPAIALRQADTSMLLAGTLTGWRSAGPYLANDSSVAPALPSDGEWRALPIEERGLLNISGHYRKPPGGRHVMFLRNTVRSNTATSVPLELAYSEDVMVWLNGQPLFRATNAFNGRYPGYLGLISSAEAVYLPLRAGDNELVIAVGERGFGWGLKARLLR